MSEKQAAPIEDRPLFWQDCTGATVCEVSLRDLFAAAALAGYEASLGPETQSTPEVAAEYAYTRADAMLAERAKR